MEGLMKLLSDRRVIVGAISLAAVGVGAYLMMFSSETEETPKPKKKRVKAGRKARARSGLGKETVLKIFKEITRHVPQVVEQIRMMKMQIEAKMKAEGRQAEERDIMQFLLAQLAQAVNEIEQRVYKEHNTTDDEVQKAVKLLGEDEEVQEQINKLRAAVTSLSAAPNVEVPEDMTEERVLQIVQDTMTQTTEALEETVKELKEENHLDQAAFEEQIKSSSDLQEALNKKYVAKCEAVKTRVHEKHEIKDPAVLQAAMAKFMQRTSFSSQLQQMSERQAEKVGSLGLPKN